MAINTKTETKPYSSTHTDNQSFDPELQTYVYQPLGYDGANLQRLDADNLAIKIVTSGTDTYVGEAAPGSSAASTVWKAYKVDSSGNLTYADGNAEFDNSASDLGGLSYS